MTTATLDDHANKESTFTITADFTDEDGAALTPNDDITWSLYDEAGQPVNSLEDVALTPPASSVEITLQGADLAIQDADAQSEARYLVIACTYNSTVGDDLPLRSWCKFYVDNDEPIPQEA